MPSSDFSDFTSTSGRNVIMSWFTEYTKRVQSRSSLSLCYLIYIIQIMKVFHILIYITLQDIACLLKLTSVPLDSVLIVRRRWRASIDGLYDRTSKKSLHSCPFCSLVLFWSLICRSFPYWWSFIPFGRLPFSPVFDHLLFQDPVKDPIRLSTLCDPSSVPALP